MQTKPALRIDNDKNGKKVAYRLNGLNWQRIGVQEAELLVSTGGALSVCYGPDYQKFGAQIVSEEKLENGVTVYRSAYVLCNVAQLAVK